MARRYDSDGNPVKPYKSKAVGMVGRFMRGKTRIQERIDNKLGRIPGQTLGKMKRVRSDELDCFDKYVENAQYDHLMPWDASDKDTYIPVRKRKPRVIYNLGKRMVDTVAAKTLGEAVFPTFRIEDDPDTEQAVSLVVAAAGLRLNALHAVKKMLTAGSSFLRFWVVGAKIRMEVYHSKYCYPTFDDANDLVELEIRYVYDDEDDLDALGKGKKKWYRLVLSTTVDILYDNPEFVPGGQEPVFEEVAREEHNLGFVQGQWFKSSHCGDSPDGESLLAYVTDLIDALNYSLSQSDQAVSYSQEPQLAFKGMDIDEIDELVRSSERAWNLGRDGDAKFVEASMNGTKAAQEFRDEKVRKITDVARICLLDPEKMVGSAQSAKAMEVLHGPLVELVNDLRLMLGPALIELATKLFVTVLVLERMGMNEVLVMPKGYTPKSLNITTLWPPIFPMTMEDLQKKCSIGIQVANASIISRETILSWVAKDFGIENVEEEKAKIAAQPQLNPFGAF